MGVSPGLAGTMKGSVERVAYMAAETMTPRKPSCPPPLADWMDAALAFSIVASSLTDAKVGGPSIGGIAVWGNAVMTLSHVVCGAAMVVGRGRYRVVSLVC